MRIFFNGVRRIIRQRTRSTPQAGAIVARRSGDELQVLIISKRDDADHWGFPKGHIERGETAEECALRELQEEAGVEGEVIAYVGAVEFPAAQRGRRIDFFLATTRSEPDPEKGRMAEWCELNAARKRLANPSVRALLARAWPEIEELFTPGGGVSRARSGARKRRAPRGRPSPS